MLLNFQVFQIFLLSFCNWLVDNFHYSQKRYFHWCQDFYTCWGYFMAHNMVCFGGCFMCTWKNMCILLLLLGVFCVSHIQFFMSLLSSSIPLLISYLLLSLSIERDLLNFPTIIIDLFIFSSSTFNCCFMYLETLFLAGYIFDIVMTFLQNWCFYHYGMFLFIPYNFFVLKSPLSDINIAIPAISLL